MIQYILGKNNTNLKNDVKESMPVKDCIFSNERLDKEEFTHLIVNHSTFANMGFRKAKFVQIDFRHCVFIDCYFKDACFEDVNFTGCKFINCDFGNVTIVECDFRYAQFDKCYIKYRILVANLPFEYNLRRELSRSLAVQSLQFGDTDEYRKYFFDERKASESHFWETFLKRQDFYKRKYGFWDGIAGLGQFVTSKINKILWGYGESIRPLLFIMGSVIVLCSVTFWRFDGSFSKDSILKKLTFSESMYFSVSSFFGKGIDITPVGSAVRMLTLVETVSGIILTGFLIAALFRYINRR